MRVNWVEEEIRLLLSFYKILQSGDMHKNHPTVIQASNEIRGLLINRENSTDPKFRNPNGIALKMANFLFLDPNYSGKGMKGCSVLDKKVFNDYFNLTPQKSNIEIELSQNLPIFNLIEKFISLIPQMGKKGSPMGTLNKFNGLAHQLNVSYAGSKIKPVSNEFCETSPIISFGLGRFSEVPWIVFSAHNQEVMNGIYPVILFYLEEDTVILSYGVSETNMAKSKWNDIFLKGLPKIAEVLPSTQKYLDSYIHSKYTLSELIKGKSKEELLENILGLINNFHNQFDSIVNIQKKSTSNMNTPTYIYPFAFKNWYSSNIGGVRLPMNENSGRPLGNKIIEGAIHEYVREMIADFKLYKGKFLCVLVGGPGNGKTDLMEFASEVFFKEFNIDPLAGKDKLKEEFKKNNRKASYSHEDLSLNLIQDASQRDESSLNPIESLYNDFEELYKTKNALSLICINRGILENILSKSKQSKEQISKYADIILKIHSFNNIQTVIDDSKIWGDNHCGVKLFTWSMDFDTLFSKNESLKKNLIKIIIEKSDCLKTFRGGNNLSPIEDSKCFLSNESKVFNLSQLLRHYEILNGKRFTYRSLFSLIGYLFYHSEADEKNYEQTISNYDKLSITDYAQRFNLLYGLYQKSVSYRFFNYFLEPKKDLISKCLNPYLDPDQLRPMFDALQVISTNHSEIPSFIISKGSSSFDPIYYDDNNFKFENDQGTSVNLKDLINKVLYNENIDSDNYSKILSPLEIELLKILAEIKNSFCLVVDYDKFNPTQLNGVDLLKTYLNNLIISIFKRSLLFSNFYIKDKKEIEEYLNLIQNDSTPFINVFADSLTIYNKIENSLSTNIGQTSSEFKNNVIEKSSISSLQSIEKPKNKMPSSDQMIFEYYFRKGLSNCKEIVIITYNLYRSIKKNEMNIFSACLDKNYLLWKELKKIELSDRQKKASGEIFIPDMNNKRIKVTRSPFEVKLL